MNLCTHCDFRPIDKNCPREGKCIDNGMFCEHAAPVDCMRTYCQEKDTCPGAKSNLIYFCREGQDNSLPPAEPPIFEKIKKVSCTNIAGSSHHSGEYDLYVEKFQAECSVEQKSANGCNIGGGVNDIIAFVREDDHERLDWGQKPPRTVVSCSILYHSRSGSYQFDLFRNEEYVQNELFTESEVEKISEILESIRE